MRFELLRVQPLPELSHCLLLQNHQQPHVPPNANTQSLSNHKPSLAVPTSSKAWPCWKWRSSFTFLPHSRANFASSWWEWWGRYQPRHQSSPASYFPILRQISSVAEPWLRRAKKKVPAPHLKHFAVHGLFGASRARRQMPSCSRECLNSHDLGLPKSTTSTDVWCHSTRSSKSNIHPWYHRLISCIICIKLGTHLCLSSLLGGEAIHSWVWTK